MAQSRTELATDLDAALKRAVDLTDRCNELSRSRDAAHKDLEQTRKQFDDLKSRLYDAEMENQRLRGYVQRVQEDDTVREELVATGDPNGEQTMVPKRKSTVFFPPHPTTNFADVADSSTYSGYSRDRPKPKHWVNY
jgi:hypothetical protein